MLTAGVMDDRVEVWNAVVERGEYGEQVTVWKRTATVWADVKFQKAGTLVTSGDVWMQDNVAVTMRYNTIVTERSRLRWDGKEYAIESLNRSKRDGSITIVASKVDNGNDGADAGMPKTV